MAADLHIHVLEGCAEKDLAFFFSNSFGSKYFAPRRVGQDTPESEAAEARVGNTPCIWIGEVSWLKAALFEDGETFIPGPVQFIHDLIGEDLPVLDANLFASIVGGLFLSNETSYSLAEPQNVADFLRQHMGKRLFVVSW